MSTEAHRHEQIMFGLFVREHPYATAPNWSTAGCRMTDYDHNSAHAIWDDLIQDNTLLGHGAAYGTTQELVRQSVRLPYIEPRAHPNTLGGLLTLALGQRITTQDGALAAYRHALTLAGSNTDLSMSAQVYHAPGQQYLYPGLKAEMFTLRNNGAFLSVQCEMIGNGARPLSTTAFRAMVKDPWLRWGDCHVWLADVTDAPLTVPSEPVQGSTNLGSNAIEISRRVVRCEYTQPCHLGRDTGYRPSSGVLRHSLFPGRREAVILLEWDVDSGSEADEVNYYLQQRALAVEWQCVGQLIAPAGTYRYGFTLLLPRVQFRRLTFGAQDALETFTFEGVIGNDGINAGVHAWVYTSEPEYLALGAAPECEIVTDGLVACWNMNEASGNREDHVGGPANTLLPRNDPLGVPGYADNAVRFIRTSEQYLYNGTDGPMSMHLAFTVAFRVRPNGMPPVGAGLITNGNSTQAGGYDFLILAVGGTGQVLVSFNAGFGGVIVSTPVLSINQWNLVMVWRSIAPDPNILSLQLNQGTIESTAYLPTGAASFANFTIGATGGSGGAAFDYFNGDIDSVMFWNRALTADERALFTV